MKAKTVAAPVKFHASFPPCDGAIRMHGDGGMRILLDIPESDMGAALFLTPLRGKVLDVEIKPAKQDGCRYGEVGKGAKRKPAWKS